MNCRIQLAAIAPIQKHYSNQVSNSVSDFTNSIALSINSGMRNDSAAYAAQVNAQTSAMQTTINDNLFGWVNGTTVTLNNTLVAFYNDIQNTVELVFGGTILETPAREFVRCLIGTKIEGIENALTFIHDNFKVNMPTVSNDVLLLSNSSVSEITRPISLAAVGDGTASSDGSGSGIIGKLIARYIASLEKERVMYFVFLALWGLVVLVALCIVLWHTVGALWLHERRRRKWEQDQSFGPFSRRPSEQSRYAFPNVPGGGSPFGTLHARALEGEEKGPKGGLMRLFNPSAPKQEERTSSPKWEEGQNVRAVIHVQGGDGWFGQLKSALGLKKTRTQTMADPYAMPVDGSPAGGRPRKVNPETLTERQERMLFSTFSARSASLTGHPPNNWLGLRPATSPTQGGTLLVRNESQTSAGSIRPALGVVPAHASFSTRSPSPPITPPGLPVAPPAPAPAPTNVFPANAYLSRQVPPVSTIPGGRVPQTRRHRPQMSSGNINPFATPFDEERAPATVDGRYPLVGRAI
jgi:hypothetical protein